MSEKVPPYRDLLWPTVEALRELGGSASNAEIDAAVLGRERFSEEILAVLHKNGPRTEVEYRLGWARSYLKGMGLLVGAGRAAWSLTPEGYSAAETDLDALHAAYVRRSRKRGDDEEQMAGEPRPAEEEDDAAEQAEWRETLLDVLMEMDPSAFERLAERLLKRAGFVDTQVMGRTGDGGIDGMGVYRLSLVSFPVFFQCKRYKGSVGSPDIRDFRGAMSGRGDKGLFITTSVFTKDAIAEATRPGAHPIDLIDGELLCDLLKQHQLGVTSTIVQTEEVVVDASFFHRL